MTDRKIFRRRGMEPDGYGDQMGWGGFFAVIGIISVVAAIFAVLAIIDAWRKKK